MNGIQTLGAMDTFMEIPQTFDELTPDWLTAALRTAGVLRFAAVRSTEATSVDGFAMTGELRRLHLEYDEEEAGAPKSLVAKLAAGDPEVRAAVHSMGFYEREVKFYTELSSESPARVPFCYFASVDVDSGASVLLLEDLSSLIRRGWPRGLSIPEAELVLRQIAPLHAAWWENDGLRELPWLRLKGMLANDRVGPIFDSQWQSFLSKLSIPLTEQILDVGRYAGRYLPWVSAHLYGRAPITLVHNDVHGDNVLLELDGSSAALLDWQLATLGRGAADVAYLLGGNLDPHDRREAWSRLIETYHTLLLERGVTDYSLEQCRIDCRLALLPAASRLATAVGFHPGLRATPGSHWDHVFPRYASALAELHVAELCAEQFG